jgi:protocatechuate 3,4-dioxygenase beta subunit
MLRSGVKRMRGAVGMVAVVVVGGVFAASGGPLPSVAGGASPTCAPTRPDIQGPFYKPNAPVRTEVGTGHVLAGTVRSTAQCTPLPGARIEFWLAGPSGQYEDAYRATVLADEAGRYRFTSLFPTSYSGRPPHIHIRVTASRHQVLVTQYYPRAGQRSGQLDLVLRPLP